MPVSVVPSTSKTKTTLGDLLNSIDEEPTDPGEELEVDPVSKEFEHYASLPAVADKNCDPLEWWRKQMTSYPYIARLARRYLCVPATSCPSERVFSTAQNIVSNKRNSLKPAKVNQLCFLAANLEL